MKQVMLISGLMLALGCAADKSGGETLPDADTPRDDTSAPADTSAPTDTTSADTGSEDSVSTDTNEPADTVDPGPPPAYLGGSRPATYFLPFDYDKTKAMPLIISLHGFGGSGAGQDIYFGLSKRTKEQGIMLVIPDGKTNPGDKQFWNATDACCDLYGSGVDDVAYITGLIEEAKTFFNIDPKRVYLVGHSNGGFMSMRMACDRSDIIAGVVNFAGSSWGKPEDCGTPGPVAALQIHGTWDTVIMYNGMQAHEGDPAAIEITVDECLSDACTSEFNACLANDGCNTYHDCLNECSTQPDPPPCYGGCWAKTNVQTKLLWMPTFLCGRSAGCYAEDWTKSWPGYPGAKEIVSRWAARNGCDETVNTGSPLDLIETIDGIETTRTRHNNCPEGVQAELWTINYGSHVPTFTENWGSSIIEWLLQQSKP